MHIKNPRVLLTFILGMFLTVITAVFATPAFAQSSSSLAPNRVNPIIWKTNYTKLSSSNFYIRIGSNYFYGAEPIRVQSDPGTDRTTLEATWFEHGVEMRIFIYFQMNPNNEWEMYDMRTYNGNKNGDWIYYSVTDTNGNNVSSLPNHQNYIAQRVFKPLSAVDAEIFCTDCSMTAFLKPQIEINEQGYGLEIMSGLQANETITLSTAPMTGYGVNALLRSSSGNVVQDQSGMNYEWYVANPQIANVYSSPLNYAEGGCAYNIQAPCPPMNGQIAGINPGVTQIKVTVTKNGAFIAQSQFDVKVISHLNQVMQSPVPAITSVPVPTAIADDLETKQLKQELEALKGTVGAIELDVAKQQKEINALQKLVNSLQKFFTNIFNRRS